MNFGLIALKRLVVREGGPVTRRCFPRHQSSSPKKDKPVMKKLSNKSGEDFDGVYGSHYALLYERVPEELREKVKLKSSPEDGDRDILGADSMTKSGEDGRLYPLPKKCGSDKDENHVVEKIDDLHPMLAFKLRASLLYRVMTHMLERKFGDEIRTLQTLADQASIALKKSDPVNWTLLQRVVMQSIETDRLLPRDFVPVERLCKASAKLIHHNTSCSSRDLARSVYVYLDNYSKYERRRNEHVDDCDLSVNSNRRSMFAIHLAHVVKVEQGQRKRIDDAYSYRYRVRDLAGYLQLLLNMSHVQTCRVSVSRFVSRLLRTSRSFLSARHSSLDRALDDYDELLQACRWLARIPEINSNVAALPVPPQISDPTEEQDLNARHAEFSAVLIDINQLFFECTSENDGDDDSSEDDDYDL